MQLYYGADRLVDKPVYGMGNSNNDYGMGFYMTNDKEMAKLWASRFEDGGYCITYDLPIDKLNILHLDNNTDFDVLYWIALLVEHRFSKEDYQENRRTIEWLISKYKINIDQYDMIVGYRADDSYFAYSKDFVRNELSLQLLSQAMKIGKLGKQYVLKSMKAFESIHMVAYEKIDKTDEYSRFRMRALNEYHVLKQTDDINNTFIRDLMREDKDK